MAAPFALAQPRLASLCLVSGRRPPATQSSWLREKLPLPTRVSVGPSSSLTPSRCFSPPPSTSYGERRSTLSSLTVKAGSHSEGATESCSEDRARCGSGSGPESTADTNGVAAPSGARPQLLSDEPSVQLSEGLTIVMHDSPESRTEEGRLSAWDVAWAQISSFFVDVDQALGGLYSSLLRHRLHSLQRSLGAAAVCSLLTAVILTSAPPGIASTQVLEVRDPR